MITKSPRNISCQYLINVLKPYYSPLKAREGEGRPYLIRAIKSILELNLIGLEPVGLAHGIPYDPITGIGFLLVERCLFIDVVAADEFDRVTKFHAFNELPFIPRERQNSPMKRLVINFGGDYSTMSIVDGKNTRALATGTLTGHLTSNMLYGFYVIK